MVEITNESLLDKIRIKGKVDGFEQVFVPLFLRKDPSLAAYLEVGGYESLDRALRMKPEEIIEEVKKSGLRGRGGAGFPTGVKWGFMPRDGRKFLVCNADEGEPATFKDRYIISLVPHLLIEGMLIAGYAIGTRELIVYIRGEYFREASVLKDAMIEAKRYIRDKFGLDYRMEVMLGAGSYIVGEETGLLNSLEGKRGNPRPRPPYPAQRGYLGYPTCVNNVETLASVPLIIKNGSDWFRSIGSEKSTGPKLFCVSGCVKNPGIYELPMGYPLKKLVELAGGTSCGGRIKMIIPGGTSTPPLTPDEIEKATMDFEGMMSFGSFLGTASVVFVCEHKCVARVALSIVRFYAEESCGQCSTCREGTRFIEHLLEKIVHGEADESTLEILEDVSSRIPGSSICAHADAGSMPIRKIVKSFRKELLECIKNGCSEQNCIQ